MESGKIVPGKNDGKVRTTKKEDTFLRVKDEIKQNWRKKNWSEKIAEFPGDLQIRSCANLAVPKTTCGAFAEGFV